MSENGNQYPIDAPGFEGRGLHLRYTGWLGQPCLWIDGRPAERTGVSSVYRLVRNDGTETAAMVRARNFGAMTIVKVDETTYRMPSGLRWPQWLWAALPLLLFVFDQFLGALMGAAAMVFNLSVLRSDKPWQQRFLVTVGITVGTVLLFLAIEAIVTRLFL